MSQLLCLAGCVGAYALWTLHKTLVESAYESAYQEGYKHGSRDGWKAGLSAQQRFKCFDRMKF